MSDVAMIVDDVVEDLTTNFEVNKMDEEQILFICKIWLEMHDSALSSRVLLHEVKKVLAEKAA